MSDSNDDGTLSALETAVNALFAADVAGDVHDAVDLEALLADRPADEPVDVDELAGALGQAVGHLLARRVVDGSGATGLAKRTVVSEVGDRVATRALRAATAAVDADSLAAAVPDGTGPTADAETIRVADARADGPPSDRAGDVAGPADRGDGIGTPDDGTGDAAGTGVGGETGGTDG